MADGGGARMRETEGDWQECDRVFRVTADELRAFVERFERLAEERANLADHQKQVMAEAKARGYDTKAMRRIIALRKRSADQVAEEQAVFDLYREALGM
jgi:uncharacterized protein (UPF0335 family)